MAKRFAIAFGSADDALKITFHPGDTWKDAVTHLAVQQPVELCECLKTGLEDLDLEGTDEQQIEEFAYFCWNADYNFAIAEVPNG